MKKIIFIFLCTFLMGTSQYRVVNFSHGTGFIVSNYGHVLTNHHVIEKCQEGLSIFFPIKGENISASLVGFDEYHDMALLKMNHSPALAIPFSTQNPGYGDFSMLLGFPSNQKRSVDFIYSTGNVDEYNNKGHLLTTSYVSKGHSGSPLLNANGQIIGLIYAHVKFFKTVAGIKSPTKNRSVATPASVLMQFLDLHRVNYNKGYPGPNLDFTTIMNQTKQSVGLVSCESGSKTINKSRNLFFD